MSIDRAGYVEKLAERAVEIAENLRDGLMEAFEGRGPWTREMKPNEQRAWFEMNYAMQGAVFVADLLATKEGRAEISRYLHTVEREEGVSDG